MSTPLQFQKDDVGVWRAEQNGAKFTVSPVHTNNDIVFDSKIEFGPVEDVEYCYDFCVALRRCELFANAISAAIDRALEGQVDAVASRILEALGQAGHIDPFAKDEELEIRRIIASEIRESIKAPAPTTAGERV